MHRPWPPMIWVGGTQGTGKSTIARRLAHEHDLPLQAVDAYTDDHAPRGPAHPPLADDPAAGPEAAADRFAAHREEWLRAVVDDIRGRGLGRVPVVVEGPQLDPTLAGGLPDGHAVFLVTTAERIARVRLERDTHGDDARRHALVARDRILDARTRAAALVSGRPAVEVAPEPDWPAVHAAVAAALGTALRGGPRLDAGSPLRSARRWENEAASRRLRSHQRARGLATTWRFPFACECGRSRCTSVWMGRPEEYATATASGPVLAAEHR